MSLQSEKRERAIQRSKAWRLVNPERYQAYKKLYYLAHREKFNVSGKRNSLKRLYGLSETGFAALIEKQKGKCPVCDRALESNPKRRHHVDHDHRTNRVRGVLHQRCNQFLGFLERTPDLIERGMQYLAKFA